MTSRWVRPNQFFTWLCQGRIGRRVADLEPRMLGKEGCDEVGLVAADVVADNVVLLVPGRAIALVLLAVTLGPLAIEAACDPCGPLPGWPSSRQPRRRLRAPTGSGTARSCRPPLVVSETLAHRRGNRIQHGREARQRRGSGGSIQLRQQHKSTVRSPTTKIFWK